MNERRRDVPLEVSLGQGTIYSACERVREGLLLFQGRLSRRREKKGVRTSHAMLRKGRTGSTYLNSRFPGSAPTTRCVFRSLHSCAHEFGPAHGQTKCSIPRAKVQSSVPVRTELCVPSGPTGPVRYCTCTASPPSGHRNIGDARGEGVKARTGRQGQLRGRSSNWCAKR